MLMLSELMSLSMVYFLQSIHGVYVKYFLDDIQEVFLLFITSDWLLDRAC